MERLAKIMLIFLLYGLFAIVLGNSNHIVLPDNSPDAETPAKSRNKHLQKSKNSSNSVTYISTYMLPTVIWSSLHSKKLRDKIRKNRNFNRVKPTKNSSKRKILMNLEDFKNTVTNFAEFGDWKNVHNEVLGTNDIQLPIEKMFVKTKFVKEEADSALLKYENTTTATDSSTHVEKVYEDIHKFLKKKKRRKNKKNFKVLSELQEKFNVSTSSNDSYALATTNSSSTDVGEPRTLSFLLFVPAIFLEVVAVGALIFLSPVLGFGLLIMTIVGTVMGGFALLLLL